MQNDAADGSDEPKTKKSKYADQYVFVVTAARDVGLGTNAQLVGVFYKAIDAYVAALEYATGEYASQSYSFEECDSCNSANEPCEECAYRRVIAKVVNAKTEAEMRARFDIEWTNAHNDFDNGSNRVKWTMRVDKTIII